MSYDKKSLQEARKTQTKQEEGKLISEEKLETGKVSDSASVSEKKTKILLHFSVSVRRYFSLSRIVICRASDIFVYPTKHPWRRVCLRVLSPGSLDH